MDKQLVFFLFAIFSSTLLFSQAPGKLNTLEVDSRTYSLYQEQNWDSLVTIGKEAIEQGINFYYLQYRMGIAYYSMKRYHKAIPFFEHVLQISPGDQAANEYLYYSFLFAGRSEDARILAFSFSDKDRVRMGLREKDPVIQETGLEYKFFNFEDYTINNTPPDRIDQKIRKELYYSNLHLNHRIAKKFQVIHGFSLLGGKNSIKSSFLPLFRYDEEVQQFQYYLGANWHFKRGMDLYLAGHYLHTARQGIRSSSGIGSGGPNNGTLYEETTNRFVGYIRIAANRSFARFRAYTSVSGFNDELQLTPGAGADIYPLGNFNLYISTDLLYQYAPDNPYFTSGLILKQKAGGRIWKNIWGELFYQVGKVRYYVDEAAYIVYNNGDAIDSWFGVKINLSLLNHRLHPYYIYQLYNQTNYYSLNGNVQSVGYNVNTHLLGVKWSF